MPMHRLGAECSVPVVTWVERDPPRIGEDLRSPTESPGALRADRRRTDLRGRLPSPSGLRAAVDAHRSQPADNYTRTGQHGRRRYVRPLWIVCARADQDRVRGLATTGQAVRVGVQVSVIRATLDTDAGPAGHQRLGSPAVGEIRMLQMRALQSVEQRRVDAVEETCGGLRSVWIRCPTRRRRCASRWTATQSWMSDSPGTRRNRCHAPAFGDGSACRTSRRNRLGSQFLPPRTERRCLSSRRRCGHNAARP